MKKFFSSILICFLFLIQISINGVYATEKESTGFSLIPVGNTLKDKGCNFQTGEISFDCIPHYIKYLIDAIVGLAGTIAVIFIMVGGFKYIFSGVSENKEAGKETIINAIIGLLVTGLAWIIVTMVISLATM